MILALAASLWLAAPASPAVAELYRLHCQQCHMADGNSPLEPLSFTDGKWKHGTAADALAKVINDGVPGTAMLPFSSKVSPAEVRALAAYVRAFDPKLKPPAKTKKK